jgi:predicted metalloprotease
MCLLLSSDSKTCRRQVKGAALIGLFLWLSANALRAQEISSGGMETETTLLKWAISQGGPAVLVLVIGWSYRRDLLSVISRKEEDIEDQREHSKMLVELIKQTAHTQERLTSVVEALTVEVKRLQMLIERE